MLSPRTASYIATLNREGDSFDYLRWLERVREEEAQAKSLPVAFTSGESAEIAKVPASDRRKAWVTSEPRTPTKIALVPGVRLHSKTSNVSGKDRLRRRLLKICDAYHAFQKSRARDALYGYLEAAYIIVVHYKVRQRTGRLLRHAFKFARLPFDRNADPFSAVIRCTCDNGIDNKTVSKFARCLRYVVYSKTPKAE